MKAHLFLAAASVVVIAGCDQKNAALEDLQRKNALLQSQIEEQARAAKAKAAEELIASQRAANDDAARRLAADRAALELEKTKLTEAQKAAAEEDIRRRDEVIEAEKRRLAEAREISARKAAEARERDLLASQPVASMQTVAEARTADIFYDALDPYGDWMDVDGYGYVFQPNVVATQGWHPYTDGDWVRTNQGWTWRSNEPFGWATYHYGRWIRLHRRGWVWVPGTEWAPAWVSWRRNDQYIGWAPLPPEAHSPHGFNSAVDSYYDIGVGSYVFVPHRGFCGGRTYIGRVVEPAQNVIIVQQTVNITNISYRTVNQQTLIVNEGPDYDRIRAESGVALPILQLQRLNSQAAHGSVASSLGVGTLALFAPVLAHKATLAKPKVVKSKEAREVDRGWSGVAAAEQAAIRDRQSAEARLIETHQRAAGSAVATPGVAPVKKPGEAPHVAAPKVAPPVLPGASTPPAPPSPAAVSAPAPVVAPVRVPAANRPQAVNPPVAAPREMPAKVAPPPAPEARPAPIAIQPTEPTPVVRPQPAVPGNPAATRGPLIVTKPRPILNPEPVRKPSLPPEVEMPPKRFVPGQMEVTPGVRPIPQQQRGIPGQPAKAAPPAKGRPGEAPNNQ